MTISKADIERKLRTNNAWVERGILALYARQTRNEQLAGVTTDKNDVGFSASDAGVGTYIARWLRAGRPLSGKWIGIARKITLRHAQQITDIANANATTATVTENANA